MDEKQWDPVTVLTALVAGGLGDVDPARLRIGWLAGHAALIRDAPPAWADYQGRLVDVRALLLTAGGLGLVDTTDDNARPPDLRDAWRVQLRGDGLVTAVQTPFDPDPELLSCEWLPAGSPALAVPPDWLADARRTGRVVLISADVSAASRLAGGGPPAPASSPRIGLSPGLPVLAGLAVLDDTP